jgi:hypothetical protein
MEEFIQLFGNLLAFVYHCFDRMVIHGYLSGLSRPEQVVYFVREVLGLPVVSKEVLRQRTGDLPGLGGGLRPQPPHPHMGIMQQMCGKVYVRPFFLGLDDPRIFLRLSRRHGQRYGDLVRQEVTKMNGDLGERPQRPQISCCLTGWSRSLGRADTRAGFGSRL